MREYLANAPAVMGILNLTPDSFSDGGKFIEPERALERAAAMIEEGAAIIDIGGESTRPGSRPVSADEESARVVPVIEAIAARFDVPISVDTRRAETAANAVAAGATIINDISGFRWDDSMAKVAAANGCGVVLMHLRGEFETMHSSEPAEDVFEDVSNGFRKSIAAAKNAGVAEEKIALDIGLGFGKTFEQNLELIAGIGRFTAEFPGFPILVGASRKSFIGKLLDEPEPERRVAGSLAAAVVAVINGASIIRAHDVKQTVDALRVATEIIGRGV